MGIGTAGGAALAALALVLTPALAAEKTSRPAPSFRLGSKIRTGTFTPAVADPRLAAELARRGLNGGSFRFTPSSSASANSRAVRVAVRARAATPAQAIRSGESSASAVTAITPTAYNLGVSVGWRRFAVSGDVAEVKGGAIPGGRKNAEVGVSYSGTRFTGRIEAGVDKDDASALRITPVDSGYSVGVGGSYRITRNLDVTGGVRYKFQRDRLEPLADQRRDSQAVYIGTAFRF
ncbi:hypothetical protein [Sphingomonas parva]|uniref:hypothetical protein n=1 Tax=Sphingomonas parva TaxID=2555898 RepID=UPI001CDBBFF6|nr:hypothetical protein [Sphingomonas parva]